MIALLIIILLFAVLMRLPKRKSGFEKTMERQEEHYRKAADLPIPVGFEDCTKEEADMMRRNNRGFAILAFHRRTGADMRTARRRMDALRKALKAGPEEGRPITGIFG